jgi:NAD(P) transhydrogenase subunit alpha
VIVGVPRETAARERRVALTPGGVGHLSSAGIRVVVERDAGRFADFGDASYRAAGASIVADSSEVFACADIVAWVKPPAFELDSMPLRPGMVLVGFQDPLYRRAEIAGLRALGVESVAFELVPRDSTTASIDALATMSRIAGPVAYQAGRRLLPQVEQSRPVRALILGCGQAGLSAVGAAVDLGDVRPTVIGNRAEQEAVAIGKGAGRFRSNPNGDKGVVLDCITEATPDLIVCTAVHRGTRAPLLLDGTALDRLGAGAVVVDLVAKAGGNCIATVADSTVTVANGVVVTHHSNYPAWQPQTASHAYGAAAAAMILRVATDLPGCYSMMVGRDAN